MPVAIPIAIAASAAAGIGGAALQSGAAQGAAQTQAQAAENAAQLQYQTGENTLGFEQEQLALQTANQQPFISTGTAAENALASGMGLTPTAPSPIASQIVNNGAAIASGQGTGANLLGGTAAGGAGNVVSNGTGPTQGQSVTLPNGLQIPQSAAVAGGVVPPGYTDNGTVPNGSLGQTNALGGGAASPAPLNTTGALNSTALNEQWATPFNAPTAAQAAQTPGEQFALQTGENAIQNSAAAQGNLLSGSTLKGLDAYSQGLASQYYQQAYQNALGQYQQNFNIFQQNQGNQFNRLQALAGGGQTAIGQLGNAGTAAAGQVANTALGTAQAIGQQENNAAAATASGYIGSANALAGGLSNATGSLGSLAMLQYLNQGQNQGSLQQLLAQGPATQADLGIPFDASSIPG